MNRLHSNPFTFIKNMLLKDKFYIVFLLLFIPLLSIFSHYFKMFLHFGCWFGFDCFGFGVPVTALKGK